MCDISRTSHVIGIKARHITYAKVGTELSTPGTTMPLALLTISPPWTCIIALFANPLFVYILFLPLRRKSGFDKGLIYVMPQNVTFHLSTPHDTVPARQAAKLMLSCPACHLIQAQLQKNLRLFPETFSEPSDCGFVDPQRASHPRCRPPLFQRPQYESLLLGIQPGVLILYTSCRRAISESLIQGRLGHHTHFHSPGESGHTINSRQMIRKLYVKHMVLANGSYTKAIWFGPSSGNLDCPTCLPGR